MPYIALVFLSCLLIQSTQAQQIKSRILNGTSVRLDSFPSMYVSKRHVDIWLPEGYSESKKYAVIYMHDGQMLFDSTLSWNHQVWNIDKVSQKLIHEKKVSEFIIVGIWNSGAGRHADYMPEKPFLSLSEKEQKALFTAVRSNSNSVFNDIRICSDSYLKFIVHELKPYIDSHFSVYKTQDNTFIMGSSMGGLISLYAICEYPEIFGGAGCLSTHWPGIFTLESNPFPEALFQYFKKKLPYVKKNKIYFDYGTETLDSMYPKLQIIADSIMIQSGFTNKNWKTLKFEGADHSEKAWGQRVHHPLLFLLGYNTKPH